MKDGKRATPRGWMAAAAFVFAGANAWAQTPAPIPVEAFFKKPSISEATISPTGRQVALVAVNKEGYKQLVVIDTETLRAFVTASFQKADVVNVNWISDKRLVYNATDPDHDVSLSNGITGSYAVDADGQDFRDLSVYPPGSGLNVWKPWSHFVAATWLENSDSVFLETPKYGTDRQFRHVSLSRVDTRTGRAIVAGFEVPVEPYAWYTGPDDQPRVLATREENGRGAIYYRAAQGNEWKQLETFDRATREGGFDFIGFADEETLFVARQPKGADHKALYTYDTKTRTYSAEPLANAKGFDLHPWLVRSRNKIVGMRYLTDGESTVWFDPELKKAQARIDALMPGRVNSIDVPVRPEIPWVSVRAYSDTDPGQYFLFNLETGKAVHLGQARRDIDPARMAQRDFVRIKARDGLELPVWTTLPKDGKKGPRPAVVVVHGGPWTRGGFWHWEAQSQFLASRGYLVIEPEFRGSRGFGFDHFKAGWKQWGIAMQNDLADATRWAIAKGLADPKRICIAGASYGGYAVLMGLVNDPDLYRCGIDWAGVTDIDLMYSITWSDSGEEYKTFGMPVLIGDKEKDAAQLRATSPIYQAARIAQPLLMGYGGRDVRVPLKHGTEFRDAVQKTNHDVEWVVYPDEGHGWRQLKTNVDWWTRVEKFLARNIGEQAR